MDKHSNDGDPFIELLEDRTRLNLHPAAQPAAAAEPPRATRRNRGRSVEFTAMANEASQHRAEFPCPSCGAPGQLDIREGTSGRCYLSCTSCFKMWQEVRTPDKVFQMTDESHWQMR